MIRPTIGFFLLIISISISADPELHWVSSGLNNRDITFSPDGNTLLTTIMSPKNLFAAIAISHKVEGAWSALTIAPFSGQYQDIEAMFSPDGNDLLFASRRPKPQRDGNDWDIWRVDLVDGKWASPVNVGDVNSTGDEFYPSIANNGNLYFTATRD
ncbi:MAG: exo-alpha-sialidase, partial [Gammaproteobacteria bacterium]|nr:exo-alpha-sialidase [Gammaproteobacteria bacterium]